MKSLLSRNYSYLSLGYTTCNWVNIVNELVALLLMSYQCWLQCFIPSRQQIQYVKIDNYGNVTNTHRPKKSLKI